MSEELKPCPACGSISISLASTTPVYYCVCSYCNMYGPESMRQEEAKAVWNALPRRLRWTKEKPTTCDFYWYRSEGGSIEIGIVYADVIGNLCIHFAGEEEPHLLELVDGEWAGPIEMPENIE